MAERKIPPAACDSGISATECLAWHIAGRVDGAKMSRSRLSIRCLCPNHDDREPSLMISVGDLVPITWHCHACGKDAALEVRTTLIRVYGVDPRCLPMSRRERAELDAMVFAVFGSGFTPCTKLVCIRALHEGLRGTLPKAPALVDLGERAGVSRAQAFRAARELGGSSLNHLFIPKMNDHVKDSKVVPAFRKPRSVSNGDSVANRDRPESQIDTGAA